MCGRLPREHRDEGKAPPMGHCGPTMTAVIAHAKILRSSIPLGTAMAEGKLGNSALWL